MKINTSTGYFLMKKSDFKDLFKIMRICLLFLFAITFQMMALNSNAQDAVIELKTSTVTINQLIEEIEKQTDYLIVYSNREIDTKRRVKVSNSSDKVSSYLNSAFLNTDISYNFENNYIILTTKLEQASLNIKEIIDLKQQQNRTVSGKITDHNGEPVIGATIVDKANPSHGTVTDFDGNFSVLDMPENATLQITYVGMKTLEIPINGRRLINAVMESDTELLDEIVVVGYGTQKKSSVTGAISQISGNELLKAPIANVNNLLAGRITGVVALQTSGQPGSDGAGILVRGGAAKYIVDGFERSF